MLRAARACLHPATAVALTCAVGAQFTASFGLPLLAAVHGAPFAVLRLGHLLHHRHNRLALDVAEGYDPARIGVAAGALRLLPRP